MFNLLSAMTHARLLADNLTAAYYLEIGSKGALGFIKARAADDQFPKLAAFLGYRVEKIETHLENSHAA